MLTGEQVPTYQKQAGGMFLNAGIHQQQRRSGYLRRSRDPAPDQDRRLRGKDSVSDPGKWR